MSALLRTGWNKLETSSPTRNMSLRSKKINSEVTETLLPTTDSESHTSVQIPESDVNYSDDAPTLANQRRDETKPPPSKYMEMMLYVVFALLFGIAILVLCQQYLGVVMTWLMDLGGWKGPMLYSTLFLVVSFPMTMGYMILNVGAGYIYGVVYGVLITSLSTTVGSALAFLACKTSLKRCVRGISKRFGNFKQLVKVLEGKQGLKIMMMTRLTPVPIGLQNALFAAADISVKRVLAATFFGLFPTQILNAYLGSTLRNIDDVLSGGSNTVFIVFQILVAIFVTVYVNHRMKREVTRACEREYLTTTMQQRAHTRSLETRTRHNSNNSNNNNNNNNNNGAELPLSSEAPPFVEIATPTKEPTEPDFTEIMMNDPKRLLGDVGLYAFTNDDEVHFSSALLESIAEFSPISSPDATIQNAFRSLNDTNTQSNSAYITTTTTNDENTTNDNDTSSERSATPFRVRSTSALRTLTSPPLMQDLSAESNQQSPNKTESAEDFCDSSAVGSRGHRRRHSAGPELTIADTKSRKKNRHNLTAQISPTENTTNTRPMFAHYNDDNDDDDDDNDDDDDEEVA